jgi:hypothetical protein
LAAEPAIVVLAAVALERLGARVSTRPREAAGARTVGA